MNTRIWILIFAVTVNGLIFSDHTTVLADSNAASEKIPVKVSVALRQDMSSVISALGTINYVAKADVSAEVDGLLQSVRVEEGDRVKKGQVIAVIDQALMKTRLKQAQADLELEELRLPQWKNEVAKVEFRVTKSRVAADNYRQLFEAQKRLFKTGGLSLARLSRAERPWSSAPPRRR